MNVGNNPSIRHPGVPTLRTMDELVRSAGIDRQVQTLFQMVDRTDEQKLNVLRTLWDMEPSDLHTPNQFKQLAFKATPGNPASDVRVQLTRKILDSSPSFSELRKQFDSLLSEAKSGGDIKRERVATLVNLNIKAHKNTEAVRSNIFFTFVHLAKLEFKSRLTGNLQKALEDHAKAKSAASAKIDEKVLTDAQVSVEKQEKSTAKQTQDRIEKKISRQAEKSLLLGHIKNKIAHAMGIIKYQPDMRADEILCKELLNSFSKETRNHPNWPRFEQRILNYLTVMRHDQGPAFISLLKKELSDGSFAERLGSLKIYSNLSGEEKNKAAFQRQLWNLQTSGPSEEHNIATLGCATSFALEAYSGWQPGEEIPAVLQPKNNTGISIQSLMYEIDGSEIPVVISSVAGPALDTWVQPDYKIYVKGERGGTGANEQVLDEQRYTEAFDRIKAHILHTAVDNPGSGRVVMAGISMYSYLDALDKKPRQAAIEIGTRALAEAISDARKLGKEVVFTDRPNRKNPGALSPILQKINEKLAAMGEAPVGLKDKDEPGIPGKGLKPGDIVVNAWDPHSLIGNKLANDNSLDGAIGSHSTVHLMHAIHSAAYAEGISLPQSGSEIDGDAVLAFAKLKDHEKVLALFYAFAAPELPPEDRYLADQVRRIKALVRTADGSGKEIPRALFKAFPKFAGGQLTVRTPEAAARAVAETIEQWKLSHPELVPPTITFS